MTSKEVLRAEARRKLRSLADDERRLWGSQIADRVWQLPQLADARNILIFASLPSEVPTAAIAAEAHRRGIQVVYPRCLPGLLEMTLHAVGADVQLSPSPPFGIPEPPADCPILDPAEIAVVFLPGLAWDRAGHRLGRGAGYYDRLLSAPQWHPFRCGLFFAIQEAPAIPVDSWDAPLDAVVTEREVVEF
jgi:5-formyltetrahydrofolate cyclo-ligase